jgi:hypothetical protein
MILSVNVNSLSQELFHSLEIASFTDSEKLNEAIIYQQQDGGWMVSPIILLFPAWIPQKPSRAIVINARDESRNDFTI